MVESIARVRHIRVTPQKARRVVALIKGKQAQEALAILKFAPQSASEPIYKLVDAGSDELVDRLARALRRELQDGQGLLSLLALDQRDDTTSLLRGHADVSHACDGLHHFSLLLRPRVSGGGPSCRPSRGRGRCGWARTRPVCGRPWSRRQTRGCACDHRARRSCDPALRGRSSSDATTS